MEKLMKPAEYAKELGISRQAVYAKIKRGILTAKDVEGKLYIVVDKNETKPSGTQPASTTVKKTPVAKVQNTDLKDYKALLSAKDETISVLKGTVKDLKKSNKQISTTLKGEIDLLKEAFHEMRSLYVRQLEHKLPEVEEIIEVVEAQDSEKGKAQEAEVKSKKWIGLKKFFKMHNIMKEKHQEKVLKRLGKAFKKDDSRLRNVAGKLKLNAEKSYEDILK
ncbi:MAG: DUF3972 domain-containing protein [Sulfurovum sp.]|nr:DUF3972 domain-containing protein [Sulfurovum sp.]